jgi:hypothetical protein
MAGFGPSYINGGGAGFVGTRIAPKIAPAPAPAPTISKPLPPRNGFQIPTFIPYYDPSRIFENIQVVKDLRQSGTERGETQTGDNGILGPGSVAPPGTGAPGAPGAPGKDNLVPIALVVAAFILFGG